MFYGLSCIRAAGAVMKILLKNCTQQISICFGFFIGRNPSEGDIIILR